ncbi:hypothetical protein [Alsobacter sp. SYSU BS001988]|jgi:hypothetical protein
MRMIIGGMVLAVVIGVAAGLVLTNMQTPAWRAFSTAGARVGDPGENLVGPQWLNSAREHSAKL